MVLEQLEVHMKQMNIITYLLSYGKCNSKRIIGLNIKYKSIKLLKVNIGENLHDIGFGNELLNTLQKAPSMKKLIN